MAWPPATATNATVSKDYLAPAINDIVARVAATTYEAGGADPITNLANTVALIERSALVLDVGSVSLRASNDAGVATGNLTLQASSSTLSLNDPDQSFDYGDWQVAPTQTEGNWYDSVTGLSIAAITLSADQVQLLKTDFDANGRGDVTVSDDQVSLTHSNADASVQALFTISDTGLSYLGSGTALGIDLSGDRVKLKSDGSGLTLYDSLGVTQIVLGEVSGEPALYLGDPAGIIYAGLVGTAVSSRLALNNSAGLSPITMVASDSAGAQVTWYDKDFNEILAASGNSGPKLSVFGVTPYGQDAFVDPTTITPEQLANYQISRGWMAAA